MARIIHPIPDQPGKTIECITSTPGIVCLSVCTNLEPEKIEFWANYFWSTGIDSKWQFSKDKKFASGHANPSPCPDNPKTCTHYLLNC